MTLSRPASRLVLVGAILCAMLGPAGVPGVAAAPEGTLTIAMHFSPVTRWLDPAEGESTITPYLLLYALHDGLLKPMPGVGSGPSLAQSWAMSKDMLSADFTLRPAKFHNGEPVTAEDVKFSLERYRGGAAKVLKDAVKEIQTPAPNRVRFVFKDPWPDFEAFDGYWRKQPSIKRIIFRSLPDETTRAAALKSGEVDLAMLLSGPTAQDIKRTPGMRLAAPLLGIFWLD